MQRQLPEIVNHVFAETSKIRAVNKASKEEPALIDIVTAGFIRHLQRVLLRYQPFVLTYAGTSLHESKQPLEYYFQRILLTGVLTESTGVGNCDAQANLAACKLLEAGLEMPMVEVNIEGWGSLRGTNQTMPSQSTQGHAFLLLNSDAANKGGYVFDTWANENILDNPGIEQYSKSIGLVRIKTPSSNKINPSNTNDWIRIRVYFQSLVRFFSDENNLKLIAPLIVNSAFNEAKQDYPVTLLNSLRAVILGFTADTARLNQLLLTAFKKWEAIADKKVKVTEIIITPNVMLFAAAKSDPKADDKTPTQHATP